MRKVLSQTLSLFNFSTKNILIWTVSTLMIVIFWLLVVTLTFLLENSPPVLFFLAVCLFALVFSIFTHLGLLLSTFVNHRRMFQWKLPINMLLVAGFVFSTLLLFNVRFLAGNSIEIGVVLFTPIALSIVLHAVQIISLIKMKNPRGCY